MYEIDKFKINWTEKNRNKTITCITGYAYQVESWQKDFFKKYSSTQHNAKVVAKMNHDDGTVTITVSVENKKRG